MNEGSSLYVDVDVDVDVVGVGAEAGVGAGAGAEAVAGAAVDRAIGAAALSALRDELRTAPKPGLVCPGDPGAHRDMDAATFAASLRALRPYFPSVARAAREGRPFAELRALGVEAEARMLAATGGVNTHRGAIFTLGVLAAAAARLAPDGAAPTPAALRETAVRAFGPALRRHGAAPRASHGGAVARLHGARGAPGEAAAGFPHLFEVALPALESALRRGAGRRAAAVQCLLASMAALPDTNLLHRGGAAGLALVRGEARAFLAAGGVHRPGWEDALRALHAALVARRLSPGGSADLLAAALFVRRLAVARGAARG